MKFAAAILCIALFSVSTADAACGLNALQASGAAATYDPFQNSTRPVPIVLRAASTSGCSGDQLQVALTPSPSNPGTGPQVRLTGSGTTLLATIVDAAGNQKPVTSAASAFSGNQVTLTLGSTGVQSASPPLQMIIQPGQAAPPGFYSTQVNLIWRVLDHNKVVANSQSPLTLRAQVVRSVWLAAGSDTHIDLGEIQPREASSFVNFQAYANVPYDIIVLSQNDFRLRRRDSSGQDTIGYTPYISGAAVTSPALDRRGHSGREIDFSTPGGGGSRRHSFNVVVDPFQQISAGSYADVVTLEIQQRV